MTWLWMLPSIVALLIKCVLFFYADVRQKYYLIFLLSAFFLVNLFELLTLIRFGYDLQVLKLYYSVSLFCTFYIVRVCASVSKSSQWVNHNICLILVTVLACYLFFTDHMVLGVKPLTNGSVTRISGEHYYIIQLYFYIALTYSLSLLIRRLVQSNDYYLKARCTIALLSFMPTVIAIWGVIGLMQLGYQINMVGVVSLSSCFMLLIFVPLSNEQKLFNTMKYVPFSRERRNKKRLDRILKKFTGPMKGESIDLKALLKELEAQLIDNTNIYFDTQREVARILTMSESSLSRKVDCQSKNNSKRV